MTIAVTMKTLAALAFILLVGECVERTKRLLHQSHFIEINRDVGMGYYYVYLYIGTPPQKQSVIIDTGSGITTVPCSDCQACGKHHEFKYFAPENSTTNELLKCHQKVGNFKCGCKNERCPLLVEYQEGSSLMGYFRRDFIVLGDENFEKAFQSGQIDDYARDERMKFMFGCTLNETNSFLSQRANGIMGIGVFSNSTEKVPNIIDFAYAANHSYSVSFSMCLGDNGGILGIGNMNTKTHVAKTVPVEIPLRTQGERYGFDVFGVLVGDMQSNLTKKHFDSEGGVTLDSGTTDVYFPSPIYKALLANFEAFCLKDSTRCGGDYKRSSEPKMCFYHDPQKFATLEEFYRSFPKIKFSVSSQYFLEWYPQAYLEPSGHYCFSFQGKDDLANIILGQPFLRNKDIFIDREHKLLRFTHARCTTKDPVYAYETQDVQPFVPPVKEPKDVKDKQEVKTSIWPIVAVISLILVLCAVLGFLAYRKVQKHREDDDLHESLVYHRIELTTENK